MFGRRGDHWKAEHRLDHRRVLLLAAPVVSRVPPSKAPQVVDEKQGAPSGPGLFVQDAPTPGDRLVPVGEQWERQITEALGVSLVGPDVVDADCQDLGVSLKELLVITSQGGELIGSAGAEVEDVKTDQDVLVATECGKGKRITVGRPWEAEIGSLVANARRVGEVARHRPIVVP